MENRRSVTASPEDEAKERADFLGTLARHKVERPQVYETVLKQADVDPTVRPDTLETDDLRQLALALEAHVQKEQGGAAGDGSLFGKKGGK